MNITEIQNEVAREHGYANWGTLVAGAKNLGVLLNRIDETMLRTNEKFLALEQQKSILEEEVVRLLDKYEPVSVQ